MGYVVPIETRAIVPPTLPSNMKFDISNCKDPVAELKGCIFGG